MLKILEVEGWGGVGRGGGGGGWLGSGRSKLVPYI